MKLHRINSRRLVAGLFLGSAFVMLVVGVTLLSLKLNGATFLVYWLICFLLTGSAAILALVDMVIIRRESREEQRTLIKETLEKTESETKEFLSPEEF